MTIAVVHDPVAQEFFAEVDGLRAVLQYRYAQGIMSVVHTGVPAALANRGIAADLTQTALEFARAQGWKVNPVCAYTRAFLQKHAGYDDLLVTRYSAGAR